MKLGIIGTRGIPNNYGGFEQFAEYLSVGLVKKGVEVYVYNPHNHPFKEDIYNGVNIIRKFDPENNVGTAGQFIYDLNCILDARKRNFDIILQLGYTSNAIWSFLLPRKPFIITNMDGLEWQRDKYSSIVKSFLKFSEKLAIKSSDGLIADSIGIQDHLQQKFNAESIFIPYGASMFENPNQNILKEFDLEPYSYNILIARLEPENNIEIILDGIEKSRYQKTVVIGRTDTKNGIKLVNKFRNIDDIRFIGPIYDLNILDNLRYYSKLYFHGHSVGGTNPSLLEAMASNSLICAHDNIFNRSVLEENAFYFSNPDDIMKIINSFESKESYNKYLESNKSNITKKYNWPTIIDQYNIYMHTFLN